MTAVRAAAATALIELAHALPTSASRPPELAVPALNRLAAQPKLGTPVLQVVHRVIARHRLGQADLKAAQAETAPPSR
jgi:hypothetical protein